MTTNDDDEIVQETTDLPKIVMGDMTMNGIDGEAKIEAGARGVATRKIAEKSVKSVL